MKFLVIENLVVLFCYVVFRLVADGDVVRKTVQFPDR